MNDNSYPWDTKEKQREANPYLFADLPKNLLETYFHKRRNFIESIDASENKSQNDNSYPTCILGELEHIDSGRMIKTLKSVADFREFSPVEFNHFKRILKKTELRKLRKSYDSAFKNTSKEPPSREDFCNFALVLSQYAQSGSKGHVQAISTLLKVNDYLASELDNLGDLEKSLFSRSLRNERDLVSYLAESNYDDGFVGEKSQPGLDSNYRVPNLGMVLQKNNRSKAYIQNLVKNGLFPNFALVLRNHSSSSLDQTDSRDSEMLFDPFIPEEDSLGASGIDYIVVEADSCNEEKVIKELALRHEKYFIFSGRGILKEAFGSGKEFIHVHPGKLPEYRGSTCPYYSILQGDGWWCTSFLMESELDVGRVISQRRFPLPRENVDSTKIYDPFTRSEVLVDSVRKLAEEGEQFTTRDQNLEEGFDYYLIHPVLEYIAKKKI